MKAGAADAPMRKLAGGPRNGDALDNGKGVWLRRGQKVRAVWRRIALKSVRSDGLARPYACLACLPPTEATVGGSRTGREDGRPASRRGGMRSSCLCVRTIERDSYVFEAST